MLETAPSLSIYSKNTEDGIEGEEEVVNLVRSVIMGDKIGEAVLSSDGFTFGKPTMDLINEEGDNDDDDDNLGQVIDGFDKLGTGEGQIEPASSPPMYLASGFGISRVSADDIFGEDKEIAEEHYRELLDEYPNHPLVLRNYAQLLQSKGDLHGAEDYYHRAMLADPGDGGILSQYAKLVWELHRDQDRALTYFEHAVQIAPKNSNVLAAYAKFLWEIDDNGNDQFAHPAHVQLEDTQKLEDSRGVPDESADPEKFYKKMIEQNPSHPAFLKKYARLLYQSKGDLQGAEEYYSRAILADPEDGGILSEYAKLLWEVYHDQERTSGYFERAVQASPGDSNILAAYASFLWAVDED